MGKMTVKELREVLAKFADEDIVAIDGGESSYGEFATLFIVKADDEDDETVIMDI